MQKYCETPWGRGGPRGNVVIPAAYWKLREVTLSYDMPAEWVNMFGFQNGTAYLSGRNVWRSQSSLIMEAEANYDSGSSTGLEAQEYFISPIPRQFVFGVRLGF